MISDTQPPTREVEYDTVNNIDLLLVHKHTFAHEVSMASSVVYFVTH